MHSRPASFLEIERALLDNRPHESAGGRWLDDDILDEMLTLYVNGGRGERIGDGVDAPTKPAQPSFPYVREPNMRTDLPLPAFLEELNMDLLKGKGAVVTGAASGIGKAIATAFIEAGASVLLCDLNAKALDAAARELGDRAIGRVTDVSDESQVEGAMRAARDAFGSLDIVVNCAGFGAIAPLTELTGREVEIRPGGDARRRLLRRKARRAADARAGTSRRHHQYLVGERAAARRGPGRLLRGEGRRGHDHALRRAGTRRLAASASSASRRAWSRRR